MIDERDKKIFLIGAAMAAARLTECTHCYKELMLGLCDALFLPKNVRSGLVWEFQQLLRDGGFGQPPTRRDN